jgi:hypothetical protein
MGILDFGFWILDSLVPKFYLGMTGGRLLPPVIKSYIKRQSL